MGGVQGANIQTAAQSGHMTNKRSENREFNECHFVLAF